MKRAYIPYRERLAAALACLLTSEQRDALRSARGPAASVISLFEMDHIHLHSFGGTDDWWNLDPKPKVFHRIKSRTDTSIAAKVKRIRKHHDLNGRSLLLGIESKSVAVQRPPIENGIGSVRSIGGPTKRKYLWPSRKLQSRNNLRKT